MMDAPLLSEIIAGQALDDGSPDALIDRILNDIRADLAADRLSLPTRPDIIPRIWRAVETARTPVQIWRESLGPIRP